MSYIVPLVTFLFAKNFYIFFFFSLSTPAHIGGDQRGTSRGENNNLFPHKNYSKLIAFTNLYITPQMRLYPSWLPPIRALLVLLGGFTIHFSLGTIYTFGNLSPYLTSYIRNQSHPHDLSKGAISWVYASAVISHGASMFIGGYLDCRIGPRLTTIIGSVVMSGGVMLSYLTIKVSYWLLILTYGVMFGLGLGMAYIGPLACAVRWLPKWKGFAGGFVVSGFGLGAVLFTYAQTLYINPHNHPLSGDGYFTHPDVLSNVPLSFLIFGGVYLAMQMVGSLLLTNPPDMPEMDPSLADGDANTAIKAKKDDMDDVASVHSETALGTHLTAIEESTASFLSWTQSRMTSLSPRQVLRTFGFYHLWFLFFLMATAVFTTATKYKFFGQVFIKDDHFLATVGSVSAIFNSAGRIFWGVFADKFTYKVGLVCLIAVMSTFVLTFYATVMVGTAMYFIWVCVLFFCVGGIFSLFPTATARSFGSKYFGTNYGILFTANSLSTAVSALISSYLFDYLDWFGYFFLVSGFCLVAFVTALLYRHRRYLPFLYRPEV